MLFLLFLIIGLYCLIPAVIVHIVMPIGIQIKEIKVEIETDRVTTEAKLSTCSIYLKSCKSLCVSYSSNYLIYFLNEANSCFIYIS